MDEEKTLIGGVLGLGCLALLAYVAFWGFILYLLYRVVMHFVG